jgi:uncharacterized protein
MFWIDLDEIESLSRRFLMISYNHFNVFSFHDRHYARHEGEQGRTVRERVVSFLDQKGVDARNSRIMLLTHLQTLGYLFNPVSFYICFNPSGQPQCAIAEVTNTFGEMKQYLLDASALTHQVFDLRLPKNFYVSPFSEPDDTFHFIIRVPMEEICIRVDDYKNDQRILLSILCGKRRALSNVRLLYYSLRFPLVTLKIIFLIHWQAFLLWMKKVPFFGKAYHTELQKEMVKL